MSRVIHYAGSICTTLLDYTPHHANAAIQRGLHGWSLDVQLHLRPNDPSLPSANVAFLRSPASTATGGTANTTTVDSSVTVFATSSIGFETVLSPSLPSGGGGRLEHWEPVVVVQQPVTHRDGSPVVHDVFDDPPVEGYRYVLRLQWKCWMHRSSTTTTATTTAVEKKKAEKNGEEESWYAFPVGKPVEIPWEAAAGAGGLEGLPNNESEVTLRLLLKDIEAALQQQQQAAHAILPSSSSEHHNSTTTTTTMMTEVVPSVEIGRLRVLIRSMNLAVPLAPILAATATEEETPSSSSSSSKVSCCWSFAPVPPKTLLVEKRSKSQSSTGPAIPYGGIPLFTLYDHYVQFFEWFDFHPASPPPRQPTTTAATNGSIVEPQPSLLLADNGAAAAAATAKKETDVNSNNSNIKAASVTAAQRPSPPAKPMRRLQGLRKLFGATTPYETLPLQVHPITGQSGSSSAVVAHRWELLRELNLTPFLLGDRGFAPVSVLLRVLRGLTVLHASGNNLGLLSAMRLRAALWDHPAIERLYLNQNPNLFETSGEELLRIVKSNPRVWLCDVASGVPLSERLLKRFDTMTHRNGAAMEAHPYNALSAQFQYLQNASSIAVDTWALVRNVWSMMIAVNPASTGPRVEDQLQAAGGGGHSNHSMVVVDDGGVAEALAALHLRAAHDTHAASGPVNLIPPAALSPLFSAVLRSVHYDVCQRVQDPLVRHVFVDLSSLAEAPAPASSASASSSATSMQAYREEMYPFSYAKALVTTFRVGLDAPNRWDDAMSVLRTIGTRQEKLGVTPAVWAYANERFLAAVVQHFAAEDVDVKVQAALVQVLALAARSVFQGMSSVAV